MTEPEESAWTRRIREHLDESTCALDADTRSRLRAARQAALRSIDQARPRPWARPLLLASAATLVLGVVLWTQWLPQSPLPPATGALADDFPMLASEEQLDLYEELDFYAWLDAQSSSPSAGTPTL